MQEWGPTLYVAGSAGLGSPHKTGLKRGRYVDGGSPSKRSRRADGHADEEPAWRTAPDTLSEQALWLLAQPVHGSSLQDLCARLGTLSHAGVPPARCHKLHRAIAHQVYPIVPFSSGKTPSAIAFCRAKVNMPTSSHASPLLGSTDLA